LASLALLLKITQKLHDGATIAVCYFIAAVRMLSGEVSAKILPQSTLPLAVYEHGFTLRWSPETVCCGHMEFYVAGRRHGSCSRPCACTICLCEDGELLEPAQRYQLPGKPIIEFRIRAMLSFDFELRHKDDEPISWSASSPELFFGRHVRETILR